MNGNDDPLFPMNEIVDGLVSAGLVKKLTKWVVF